MDNRNSLSKQAAKGLKWSYISTGGYAFIQIFLSAAFARLLSPSAFGTMALTNLILQFTQYFIQMGMGSALIQKKDISSENIRAAFTFSVILSILASGIIFLAAPLLPSIFPSSEKSLSYVVRVMGFSFILAGAQIVSTSLLRRNFQFKKLAVSEIGGYLFGYGAIGIPLAIIGYGIWSLVVAVLAQNTFTAVICYCMTKHNILPLLTRNAYKDLLSYGYKISLIGFLEFISSNMDTFFIGRFLGPAPLGIYNRSKMLISLPLQYLSSSLTRVLFSLFSRITYDKDKMREYHALFYLFLGILVFFFSYIGAAASKEIVSIILGKNWDEAVPVFRIMALATPFLFMAHIEGVLSEANAKLNEKLFVQIIYIIYLLCGVFTIKNITLGKISLLFSLGYLLQFVGYSIIIIRHLKIGLSQISSYNIPLLIIGSLSFTSVYCAIQFLPQNIPDIFKLTVSFLFAFATTFLYIRFFRTKIVSKSIYKLIKWAVDNGKFPFNSAIIKFLHLQKVE